MQGPVCVVCLFFSCIFSSKFKLNLCYLLFNEFCWTPLNSFATTCICKSYRIDDFFFCLITAVNCNFLYYLSRTKWHVKCMWKTFTPGIGLVQQFHVLNSEHFGCNLCSLWQKTSLFNTLSGVLLLNLMQLSVLRNCLSLRCCGSAVVLSIAMPREVLSRSSLHRNCLFYLFSCYETVLSELRCVPLFPHTPSVILFIYV